jgi:hypothetical protein
MMRDSARCVTAAVLVTLAWFAGCGRDPGSAVSPTSASLANGDAAADGSTLKAAAPVPVAPINGVVVGGSFTTMTALPAMLKFVTAGPPLRHQFELYDSAGVRVQTDTLAASTWAVSGLRFDSRYTWRVRAVLDGATSPWSTLASFATPAPSFVVSGRIIFAPDGPPIPGARLQIDGLPVVTADASGRFAIGLNDSTIRHATITAGGAMTRETYLRGDENRTCVDLDLVPAAPAFEVPYREEVHNAKDLPLTIARHWMTAPNFSLVATWKDTTEAVDPAVLTFTIGLIRQYVPIWTSGRLEAGQIEIIPSWRPPDRVNWVSVYWVHDQFRGMAGTGSNPGFMHFNSATTREPATIIHELGHTLGLHHTSTFDFMMGPHQLTQTVIPPDELRIARILYSRPPGNRDPDVDPADIFIQMPEGPGNRGACAP